MPACRNCGATLDGAYRFCPMCATPQTQEAARRFREYAERRGRRSGRSAGAEGLEDRLRYAAGFVAVVAGLATLATVAGVFFLLAGLFVLPPVRDAVEDRLGRPVDQLPTVAGAGALVCAGLLVLVVL